MIDLTALFCNIDDFWINFKLEWEQHLIDSGKNQRGPDSELSLSEMMTIVILFHLSHFRNFKHFYYYIEIVFKQEFPKLISYSRFVYLKKNIIIPLFAYLLQQFPLSIF